MIIDEAAQSSEVETLEALRYAEQLVLVGDHLQLGPVFKVEVQEGTESMFARLIEA